MRIKKIISATVYKTRPAFFMFYAIISVLVLLESCSSMPFVEGKFKEKTSSTQLYSFAQTNVQDIGKVYHYLKTDSIGILRCDVWIYIASATHTESFKIYPFPILRGTTDLVTADYDVSNFQTKKTTSLLVSPDGSRKQNLSIETSADGTMETVTNNDGSAYSIQIGHTPTYNWNFDWCDFGFMYRQLINKNTTFEVGVTSVTSDFHLLYAGKTKLIFEGKVDYLGKLCNYYSIQGEAFGDKVGKFYADANTGAIVEITSPVPDNPNFRSFRLTLLDSFDTTSDKWNEFIFDKTKKALWK